MIDGQAKIKAASYQKILVQRMWYMCAVLPQKCFGPRCIGQSSCGAIGRLYLLQAMRAALSGFGNRNRDGIGAAYPTLNQMIRIWEK